MLSVKYDEGKAIAEKNVCGECGAPLTLAWGGYFGIDGWIVRCGVDAQHDGYVRPSRNVRVPIFIQNILDEKEKRKMEEEHGESVTTAMSAYQGVTSLTEDQAAFILRTCWPKAPATAVLKAAMICSQYHLNPLMKHLHLVEYKGRDGSTWEPIFGISATRLIASRKGSYNYKDGPRVMTEDEQLSTFGETYPTQLCVVTKISDSSGNTAPGYGFWPKSKEPYGTDKGNTKFNMASIHSERQAFDRLLPGEMPADINVGATEYLNHTEQKAIEAPAVTEPKAKFASTPDPQKPITKAHVGEISSLRDKLGMPDDEYTQALEKRFGKYTSEELTDVEAQQVIDGLTFKLEGKE